MSREMTMKLNQILYQRSKDWLENRPKTGILNILGRAKPDNEKERSSFDDYLRGHIKTSNKTINIRGLFRVPDVSSGERLMINAEEKDEDLSQREQKMQLPLRDIDETWNRLPAPNEALPNLSKAKMSYPLGKPNFPEQMHDFHSETDYQTIGQLNIKLMQQKPRQMLHRQK